MSDNKMRVVLIDSLQKPVLACDVQRFGPAVDAKFHIDVLQMEFDGAFRQIQLIGDMFA